MRVMIQSLTLIPVAHLQKKWFSKNNRRTKEQAEQQKKKIENEFKPKKKNRNQEFRMWYAKAKLFDRSLCVCGQAIVAETLLFAKLN